MGCRSISALSDNASLRRERGDARTTQLDQKQTHSLSPNRFLLLLSPLFFSSFLFPLRKKNDERVNEANQLARSSRSPNSIRCPVLGILIDCVPRPSSLFPQVRVCTPIITDSRRRSTCSNQIKTGCAWLSSSGPDWVCLVERSVASGRCRQCGNNWGMTPTASAHFRLGIRHTTRERRRARNV